MGSNIPTILTHQPIFGLDVGHGSVKVMQVVRAGTPGSKHDRPTMTGYGYVEFDVSAVDDGVIVKPEIIAAALLKLFDNQIIGDITTRRIAMAIPSYRSFSRAMQLPALAARDLDDAVRLEAEQYIPLPIDQLYMDYTLTDQSKDMNDYLAIAVPKTIVDSYLVLARMVGLEVMLVETTMAAAARLFAHHRDSDVSSVIIDFGSLTADLSIFNRKMLVTGTVGAGGLVFTNAIKDGLGVTFDEAALIKTRYGLGLSKKQKEISAALDPTLKQLIREIQRMIRYQEKRYGADNTIGQIVMLGGGSNMPGLSEYLTNALRLPVRVHDPWQYLDFAGLQAPSPADKLMYATVAGLSLVNPREVFL